MTLLTVRVPVPPELVNCPPFAHETLQRGPSGGFDGPWFGDVPLTLAKVESDGGPAGSGDLSRGRQLKKVESWARKLLGLTASAISPERDPIGNPTAGRGLHTAALDWKARLAGVPLHTFFGQRVRDGVPIAWWSGHRTPEGDAAGFLDGRRTRGFTDARARLVRDPIDVAAGHATTPNGPGLGIDPDLEAMERYRVGDPILVE